MYTVDLNSDLGESFGNYSFGNDQDIIALISSANVACGFHAGDPLVMEETVKKIKEDANTGLGAHPGFPDRQGFGRRYMDMADQEIRSTILYQLSALEGMAGVYGLSLNHVKPHGALYNATFKDDHLARVIAQTVKDFNPHLKLMGLSGQNLVKAGEEVGLQVINEVFADRAYERDGTLVSRRKDGALIHDAELSLKRVIRMIKEERVEAITGEDIAIKADSICVHGDGINALAIVKNLKDGLEKEGIQIKTI